MPIGGLVGAELERAALGDTGLRGELGRLLSTHLPGVLATRCTLGPLRAGRLIVYVDCPTYLYELRARWATSLGRALRAADLPVPVHSVTFRLAARGQVQGRRMASNAGLAASAAPSPHSRQKNA